MTWLHDLVDGWRSGSRRSQLWILAVLVVAVGVSTAISWISYDAFPVAAFFVWLLLGRVLLRFWPMLVLTVAITAGATTDRWHEAGSLTAQVSATVALLICVLLVLYVASRQRTGLPGPLSEALLADLRGRLDATSRVQALPEGWRLETATLAAFGIGYAGDFMVADLDEAEGRLDMVLVDVVGKGVKAAPTALLLAGALGGLVGAVRGPALLEAANTFLLRQDGDETFATAVHVTVCLRDGSYAIRSAGHPPALRRDAASGEWTVEDARGLALGILPEVDLEASEGVLAPGDALMFYTDGVVERRTADIDTGIDWLRGAARTASERGLDGLARRLVRQVERGDDDRALLVISRAGRGPGG